MSIESVGEPVLAVSMLGRPCLALDKRADPLTHATVIHLRLDYLPNALMFMPLAPLWRLGFPRHPLRRVIPAGLALAIGLEGVQYLPASAGFGFYPGGCIPQRRRPGINPRFTG
jgi:hypothetical protein